MYIVNRRTWPCVHACKMIYMNGICSTKFMPILITVKFVFFLKSVSGTAYFVKWQITFLSTTQIDEFNKMFSRSLFLAFYSFVFNYSGVNQLFQLSHACNIQIFFYHATLGAMSSPSKLNPASSSWDTFWVEGLRPRGVGSDIKYFLRMNDLDSKQYTIIWGLIGN